MVILTRWLIMTCAILTASWILPGIGVDSLKTALIAAAVLGIINAFLRPVLLILTLPLTVLTLGVFAFVINALMIMLVAYFVPGFEVKGFFWAFLGALIVSIVSWIVNHFIRGPRQSERKRRKDVIDLERGDDGQWR